MRGWTVWNAGCVFLGLAMCALAGASPAAESPPPSGPLAGAEYAPARRFVTKYCAECHTTGGTNPRKKRALPQQRLDTYDDWHRHQSVLKGVLDRWHPDGKVMPPSDAHAQPPDDERRAMLDWLSRGSPNTASGK